MDGSTNPAANGAYLPSGVHAHAASGAPIQHYMESQRSFDSAAASSVEGGAMASGTTPVDYLMSSLNNNILPPASSETNGLSVSHGENAEPKPKIRIKLKLGHTPQKEALASDDVDMKNEDVSSDASLTGGENAQSEEGADEEDWLCLKCINNNGPKRIRCWNCKGWKGGKRENFNPHIKNDEDDPMEVDSEPAAELQLACEVTSQPATVKATSDADAKVHEKHLDSDSDDMPMMSLKSKPSKKKKSKSSASTKTTSPSAQKTSSSPKPQPAVKSSTEPKKASKKSHPKTKLFSGTLRSAAAAHRNRQIHVPPIGSPGLLMLPNPSLIANFPTEDNGGGSDKKKKTTIEDITHLLHNGYILPRTVFEQSIIAGGYTLDKRKNTPHRGSSTTRIVGDMFDSDVNLYLHFPELIPLDVWERRLAKKKKVKVVEEGSGQAVEGRDEVKVKDENGATETLVTNASLPLEQSGPTDFSSPNEGSEQGPRLVDVVIRSLCKLTGDTKGTDEARPDTGDSTKPDTASSEPGIATQTSPSSSDTPHTFLPKFNPSRPGTRKRSRPHQPMSFLDMIPISLTSTYPPEYVEKRRAYSKAVKEREHLIIESQEAHDDAVDNREKYQAHKEAWDRMFEYQKQQIAKREAAAEEAERKAKEEEAENAEEKSNEASNGNPSNANNGAGGGESDTKKADANSGAGEGESDAKKAASNSVAGEGESDTKKEEPKERKKEDPMDYMPQPPQLPPPERFVTVPDIPIPPTPPSLVEVDEGSVETTYEKHSNKMYVPKHDPSLIKHLDPDCFLPSMEGRYFGLLSNDIADPQFVGYAASGIRGVSAGGGTGLATSYVGGGRGAAGLVSGPLRGGMQSWQQARDTQTASSTNSSTQVAKPPVKKAKEPPAKPEPKNTSEVKDKPIKKKEKSSPEKSAPTSSSSKKKRRASETDGTESNSSKKKGPRAIPLATGDRNTLATEIASGPAGDEFPEGWTVKTYRRAGGETVGKTDRFWFSPGLNIRFRAKKHAMSFIDIMEEPEINGDEQAAAETYRARGLHF